MPSSAINEQFAQCSDIVLKNRNIMYFFASFGGSSEKQNLQENRNRISVKNQAIFFSLIFPRFNMECS